MKENVTKTVTETKASKAKTKKTAGMKKKLKKEAVKINLYDDSLFMIRCKNVEVVTKQILGTRKKQQDSYAHSGSAGGLQSSDTFAWSIVCDGMGGMASGELASMTTVEVFKQVLSSINPEDSIPDVLSQAVQISNQQVRGITGGNDGEMSGTTLVCTVFKNNNLYCASVGDSRIYIARGEEFKQLTRDHNYFMELQDMVRNGEISYEDALADPQKEALVSYIGIDELKVVDINREPIMLSNGDIILLCSDGLTKVLDDDTIFAYINAYKDNLDLLLENLLNTVQIEKPTGLDNTTISVIKYIEN